MLFGTVHPALRTALGVVVLVVGVALHKVILDVAGAAVILIGAGQWLYRARRTGPAGSSGSPGSSGSSGPSGPRR